MYEISMALPLGVLPLGVEPRDVHTHFGKDAPDKHVHRQARRDQNGDPLDAGVLTMKFDDADGVTEADVKAKVDTIAANPNDPTLPSQIAKSEATKPTLEQRVAALEAALKP